MCLHFGAASQIRMFLLGRSVDSDAEFSGLCFVSTTVLYGLGRLSYNVGSLWAFSLCSI